MHRGVVARELMTAYRFKNDPRDFQPTVLNHREEGVIDGSETDFTQRIC